MTTSYRAGLVLFALLSLVDLADLFLTDGSHPPYLIAAIGAALGLTCLALLPAAWRGGRRSLAGVVVLRIVSALTALPAFFVAGVGAAPVTAAAAIMIATAVAVLLVARRRTTPAVAR